MHVNMSHGRVEERKHSIWPSFCCENIWVMHMRLGVESRFRNIPSSNVIGNGAFNVTVGAK